MSGGKHAPARLSTYIQYHQNVLNQFFQRGFIIFLGGLAFELVGGQLIIDGRLHCLGNIYIDIAQRARPTDWIGGEPVMQTVGYSYNVSLRYAGNVFRYDSPHPTHNRDHHVHRFDVLDGDTDGTLMFLYQDDRVPDLGDVLAAIGSTKRNGSPKPSGVLKS